MTRGPYIPDEPNIRFAFSEPDVRPRIHILQREQLIAQMTETFTEMVVKNSINLAITMGISDTLRRANTSQSQSLIPSPLSYPSSSDMLVSLICYDLEKLLIRENVLQGIHLLLTSPMPDAKSGVFQIGRYESFQLFGTSLVGSQPSREEDTQPKESSNTANKKMLALLVSWNADTLIRNRITTTRPPYFFDWALPPEPNEAPYFIYFANPDHPEMTPISAHIIDPTSEEQQPNEAGDETVSPTQDQSSFSTGLPAQGSVQKGNNDKEIYL